MSRGNGMRDVELDDGGPDDGGPGAGDEAARARGDPRHGQREPASVVPAGGGVGPALWARRRWLLLACALALLAVVVVDGVRARAREAHLAAVAGVLEPMDSSLREVWTQPGGWQHPAVHGPDLMVSIFGDLRAGFRLVGNDIATGEQQWDVTLPDVASDLDVECRALGPDVHGRIGVFHARSGPGAVSTHIVCRLVVPAAPGAELPAHGPGSEVRLVVLDAQTGETVADRSLEYGFGTVETLRSDLLVTTVLSDGRVQVTREDPLTGRARWTARSEQRLPGAGFGRGPQAPETRTEHGVIVVSGLITMALSEDGDVLGEWPAEGGQRPVELTVLADGRFVVGTPDVQGTVPYGTVSASDAGDGFPIDGPLLRLAVDDGSASDLLLTTRASTAEIVALDARTGEPRWSAEATPEDWELLLDDRLITTYRGDLVAVDTRTGRRLWTAADDPQVDRPVLTDGHVVIFPTGYDDQEPILTAIDITDGRALWTAAGPPGTVAFFEIGRRLIALQQEQMTRLG